MMGLGAWGLEGGPFSPISDDYGDKDAALQLPITGTGGRLFVPICVDYGDDKANRPCCARVAQAAHPQKKRSITCCPRSCEPSQRRWIRSRKCLKAAQARASAGADYGGSSTPAGADHASSVAWSTSFLHRRRRTVLDCIHTLLISQAQQHMIALPAEAAIVAGLGEPHFFVFEDHLPILVLERLLVAGSAFKSLFAPFFSS